MAIILVVSYDGVAAAAIKFCGNLINGQDFGKLSLGSVKNFFADPKKRNIVAERYEVAEADLKNQLGEKVLPSTRPGRGGLLASANLIGILDHFNKNVNDDPYCERVRYLLRKGDQRTIPVIITEKINEIIMTANLSGEEYNYVIDDLLRILEEAP